MDSPSLIAPDDSQFGELLNRLFDFFFQLHHEVAVENACSPIRPTITRFQQHEDIRRGSLATGFQEFLNEHALATRPFRQ